MGSEPADGDPADEARLLYTNILKLHFESQLLSSSSLLEDESNWLSRFSVCKSLYSGMMENGLLHISEVLHVLMRPLLLTLRTF